MSKQKQSIVEIISDIIMSLSHIYNILSDSSEEEVSSILDENTSIHGIFSDIQKSLLSTFLDMPPNCWRILDYVRRYKAITVRNLENFLHVSDRQIYRYMKQLVANGFVNYTTLSLGRGPPTRFYHFHNLTRYELDAAESLERMNLYSSELHLLSVQNNQYICQQCGMRWSRDKSLGDPEECVYCKQKEVKLCID